MSVQDLRAEAVAETIDRARGIIARMGVTREALERIAPEITALAGRSELFPPEQFPLGPNGASRVYYLAQDPNGEYAIYASAGTIGKAVPPHNHTTWAIISGVYGDEHNVVYERVDNRAAPGEGKLREARQLTVRRGNAIKLMPDDFHTIQVTDGPSLHLHFYGRNLEALPERIYFKELAGGAYQRFPANLNITSPVVSPAEVKAMLRDGGELALLDVREEGAFAKSHLLFAVNLPVSQLEFRLASLVPRRRARIVLCDGNDGLAEMAAAKLRRFGYQNVSIMMGGIEAWQAAGYELFSGVYVPSKAFGEVVEHREETPNITAEALKAKIDAGEDLVILDSRPMDEFEMMNIPGGLDCPGGELVYRIHEVVKSPKTLVVVNCAGRTRSIIGAQSLINAGIANPVVALRNGTMGWHLAGLSLEHGQHQAVPAPSSSAVAKARKAAAAVASRFGVSVIGAAELARLESERRTLYLFDVRDPAEFLAGHIPGARSAPGGQLVQSTDTFVGVRNARIVLADSDGVRARMTASWLVQMGAGEVHVLDHEDAPKPTVAGEEGAEVLGLARLTAEMIAPDALAAVLARGEATLIDLDNSTTYRKGHIPGAWWAVRARLATALPKLPIAAMLVLTSQDGRLAILAAAEVEKLAPVPVKVLQGGTRAWRERQLPVEIGDERLADTPDDVVLKPYQQGASIEDAMRQYLAWEVDLVGQIERDGDAPFLAARAGA
jgi:rhodanese-related sulfurtransferase/predicted metal-dependent enzyme (double-stranded beta helix superfamily)